jgi:hypothetical protein
MLLRLRTTPGHTNEPIEPQQIAILEIYLVLAPPAAGVKWHALPAIHSLLAGSL